jgi:hypothetical protein
MQGRASVWRFEPDLYLDHRRDDWGIEERMGHVKYDADLHGVLVHMERGQHIGAVLHAVIEASDNRLKQLDDAGLKANRAVTSAEVEAVVNGLSPRRRLRP